VGRLNELKHRTTGRDRGRGPPPTATAIAPVDLQVARPAHDTDHVGLNPFRQHRRSPADIVMVAGALIVCIALVAWAFLG